MASFPFVKLSPFDSCHAASIGGLPQLQLEGHFLQHHLERDRDVIRRQLTTGCRRGDRRDALPRLLVAVLSG